MRGVERPANGVRGNPHRGLSIVGGREPDLAVQFRWSARILALVDLDLKVRVQNTVPIYTDRDDAEGYVARLCAVVADALGRHAGKDVWSVALSGPLRMEVPNMLSHGRDFSPRLPDRR